MPQEEEQAAPPPYVLQNLQDGPWGAHLRTVSSALCTLGLHALGESASGRALSRHLRERLADRTHQAFDVAVLPAALAYAQALAAAYLPLAVPSQVCLCVCTANRQMKQVDTQVSWWSGRWGVKHAACVEC